MKFATILPVVYIELSSVALQDTLGENKRRKGRKD